MKSFKLISLLFLSAFFFCYSAKADVKLPRIFSSNMVLQQGIEIPVWGWADKGERITVKFDNKSIRTKAGNDGKWMIKLPVQEYGGPHILTVQGKNTIEFNNVMIGEVWICSGQSNMQWRVDQSNNAESEIAASNLPKIRLFEVPRVVSQYPQEDINSGEWVECSPETVPGFSAVGFFFGKNLLEKLDVPIGLIHTSWGGTVAETWISPESIANDPDFKGPMAELQQIDMKKYREDKMEQVKRCLEELSRKKIWECKTGNRFGRHLIITTATGKP